MGIAMTEVGYLATLADADLALSALRAGKLPRDTACKPLLR